MLSRDRGREEYLPIARGERCPIVEPRRSMFVGGDPSCFLLLVEVVGELLPGAFLCALERNVFVGKLVGELQEGGRFVGLVPAEVLERGLAYMSEELV